MSKNVTLQVKNNSLELVLSSLRGVKKFSNYWTALCPAHNDQRNSLSISQADDGRVLLHCHAGCNTEDIIAAIGLEMKDLFPTDGNGNCDRSFEIIKTYDYKNEDGKLLFQVCRLKGKNFLQRKPDGKGGWIWNVKNVNQIPYRLPEILVEKKSKTVLIVEGEKDVDNLVKLEFSATCNSGGAGKWKKYYNEYLRDAHVAILPDNDTPGKKHAEHIAKNLHGIANEIRVLKLPNLPEKGDVTDWLHNGGTKEKLMELVKKTPIWKPPDKPVINVTGKELSELVTECWDVVQKSNTSDPLLFNFGGSIVRIEHDREHSPKIVIMTENRMRTFLAYAASWGKTKNDKFVPVFPNRAIIQTVLTVPELPLSELKGIVKTPIFASDGTFSILPGYNPKTMIYYSPRVDFHSISLPLNPDEETIEKAKKSIIEDLLGDFPFVSDTECTHAIALLLLPFVREMVQGPTPLHLIEKSTPGTGATLLAESIARISTGHSYTLLPEGKDNEEWRKRITATLKNAPQFIVIDNVKSRIASGALSSVLTSSFWEDRILGCSETLRMPNRCAWVATGNNPTVSSEIARRTIRIRLDAKIERPWLRKQEDFRHPNILQWIAENRALFVSSCCTLIQAWVCTGMPKGTKTLGMFESWSSIMGGIFKCIGISGFLGNLEKFYEENDIESSMLNSFVSVWFEKHQSNEVKIFDLYEIASSDDSMLDLGNGSERSQKTRLGKKISSLRDRCFSISLPDGTTKTVCIQRGDKYRNAQLWKLSVNI